MIASSNASLSMDTFNTTQLPAPELGVTTASLQSRRALSLPRPCAMMPSIADSGRIRFGATARIRAGK